MFSCVSVCGGGKVIPVLSRKLSSQVTKVCVLDSAYLSLVISEKADIFDQTTLDVVIEQELGKGVELLPQKQEDQVYLKKGGEAEKDLLRNTHTDRQTHTHPIISVSPGFREHSTVVFMIPVP
mgnify:CR=1 FL=1